MDGKINKQQKWYHNEIISIKNYDMNEYLYSYLSFLPLPLYFSSIPQRGKIEKRKIEKTEKNWKKLKKLKNWNKTEKLK